MEAIPGMAAAFPPGADSGAQLRQFVVIMQSMTKKELDCRVDLTHPRVLRIARGAGVHPQVVLGLVEQHKQMEKMMTGMGKAGLLKGGDEAMAAKLKRNPNAVMQAMQKSVDPGMLSKLGGMGNLMCVAARRGGALAASASQPPPLLLARRAPARSLFAHVQEDDGRRLWRRRRHARHG